MAAYSKAFRIIGTISVPALTVAVGLSAGPLPPAPTALATRSEVVALAASINTSPNDVGVAESSLYYMDQSDLDTAMSELQTMGVTQVRVLLPWQYMEPTDGTYNWTQADQLLTTAAKYGIAVDADITSSPGWASTASGGGTIPNAAPNSSADAAYAAFAAAVAARYTTKISAIEVWNEPNSFTGWYPGPSAAAYTTLLQDAYTAIKAADPNITVVAGVLGAGVTLGSLTLNPVTFLQQMYADGAAGFFDALSFHPYNPTATFSSGATVANSALQQLEALRSLMNANGDAAKLIWATEYGESSAGTGGQAQQAAYIEDFLNTWSTLAGVGPAFLYSLIDDNQGNNMGLFTDDWTPKAAVAAVEAWIAAHPLSTPAGSTVVSAVSAVAQAISNALTSVLSGVVTTVQKVVSGITTALANFLKALTGGTKSTATSAAAQITADTATATPRLALTTSTTITTSLLAATTKTPNSPTTVAAKTITDSPVRRQAHSASNATTTTPATTNQQLDSQTPTDSTDHPNTRSPHTATHKSTQTSPNHHTDTNNHHH